jgi:UDP-N-acetylmuramate--alanine ligase
VVPLPEPASLAEMVNAIAKPGDYVVCLGAGSITGWAHALPEQLAGLAGATVATDRARGAGHPLRRA